MCVDAALWAVEGPGIKIFRKPHLDLNKTLDCGQCFRWKRKAEAWHGIVGNRTAVIREAADGWLLSPCTEQEFIEFWVRYLDLHRDYLAIEDLYRGLDSRLDEALDLGRGIRILRQPFWETVLSFVLSANNNIPRIQGMIERLARAVGDPLDHDRYGFPEPAAVSTLGESELRAMGFGYRAPFVVKLAQGFLASSWGDQGFIEGPTAEVRKRLLTLPGVGPKVADCILLFGLGRLDAFPVDTWIRKVLAKLDEGKPEAERILTCIGTQARCEAIGYVQQVLFYAARYEKWRN